MTKEDALTIEPLGYKIASEWVEKFVKWHDELKAQAVLCDTLLREVYTPENGTWNIVSEYIKPEIKEYVIRTHTGIKAMLDNSI